MQVVQDDGDRIRCQAQRGRHRAGQLLRGDRTRSDPAQRLARPGMHDRHQPGRHGAPERVRVIVGLVQAHPHPLRPAFPARSQDAAKMVLPQPAAAATTVTGAPDGAVTSGCRRARETTSVTTGGENFSAEYPPTVGLVPAGRSPLTLRLPGSALREGPRTGSHDGQRVHVSCPGTDQPATSAPRSPRAHFVVDHEQVRHPARPSAPEAGQTQHQRAPR